MYHILGSSTGVCIIPSGKNSHEYPAVHGNLHLIDISFDNLTLTGSNGGIDRWNDRTGELA